MRLVMASRCMSVGHVGVSTEGIANWWRLLEKVAVIVIVDLL